jgi:hypothetical protein
MIHLTTTIHTEDREITVTATVTRPVRGKYFGPPEHCYPDEPAEVYDIEAQWDNGAALSDNELEIYVDKDVIIERALEQYYEECV